MYAHYELGFSIGATPCQLIGIQPDSAAALSPDPYYDHYHQSTELHYITHGECEFSFGKTTLKVHDGELLIIPPRSYHREISSSEDISKMSMTVSLTEPEGTVTVSDSIFYDAFDKEEPTLLKIKNTPLERRLLAMRERAREEISFLNREWTRADCSALLLELFEKISPDSMPDSEQEIYFSRENIVDNFFAQNFMRASSKNELANKLYISPRQLHRVLKKKYGKNYREKLSEIRVEIATSFLSGSDKSISEISELLGYSTPANFSTFIKNATGKTPSEIRKGKK